MLLALVLSASLALAGDLDDASNDALVSTQKLLTDPALRAKAVKENSGAAQAHQQADLAAGGGANTEALYGLSSEIFEDMVKQTGGDPLKLQELIQKAMKDPESFGKNLSP